MDSEHIQVVHNQLQAAGKALDREQYGFVLSQLEVACRVIERNTDESRDNG